MINSDEDAVIDLPLTLYPSKKFQVFLLVFFVPVILALLYGSVIFANVWLLVATLFLRSFRAV